MQIITLLVGILLTCFSTLIMSYISIATGIGPWIETTLVLMGMLIFAPGYHLLTSKARSRALGLISVAGGIGGIAAVGCGFTFPTYYFLDPQGFSQLLATPWHFAGLLTMTCFAAGAFGLMCAHYYGPKLLAREDLPFPIGELVYKMIGAADNLSKAISLAVGFIGTQLFLGIQLALGLLSKPVSLIQGRSWGALSVPRLDMPLEQLPMFWAIGFVTGHVIAIPLLVGLISKVFVIDPLFYWYPTLCEFLSRQGLFSMVGLQYQSHLLTSNDFTIAFCSGLVFFGALESFIGLPQVLRSAYDKFVGSNISTTELSQNNSWHILVAVLLLNMGVFSFLGFSLLSQLYLLGFTLLCTYQLMMIAGKFGLAPMGRFATFVVVPGMLLFGFTALQITCVAMYVETAGGVACDALFGRKMGQLAAIESTMIIRYQWLGLAVASLAVGGIFLALIGHFGLGNEVGALAATRSASRALLLSIKSFDVGVLALGLFFGYCVSFTRVSPALLLAGILMPLSYSLMLVGGGLSTYLVKDKEEQYPFWSGVFAANSLWMLVRAFI